MPVASKCLPTKAARVSNPPMEKSESCIDFDQSTTKSQSNYLTSIKYKNFWMMALLTPVLKSLDPTGTP